MDSEALVIGGGIVGLSTALALADAGVRVRVLERTTGHRAGASHAAAGMLAYRSEAGAEDASFRLARAAAARWPAWIERLGGAAALDVRDGGTVWLVPEGEGEAFARSVAWQREAGLELDRLEGARLERLGPAAAGWTGFHFPDELVLDPRRVLDALVVRCREAGVVVETSAAVEAVLFEADRVAGVRVAGGDRRAGIVVNAAGAWAAELTSRAWVRPLRGQMLALEAPALPVTVRLAHGYLVSRAGGQVLVGSTEEAAGFDASTTPEALAALASLAARAVPSLAGARRAGAWAGLRPVAADRLPLVGAGRMPGLWYATGHGRNGILLAPLTAEALAAWITKGKPGVFLEPWSPSRFGL